MADMSAMAEEDAPYRLDIASTDLVDDGPAHDNVASIRGNRPWIGILFECCGAYARVTRPPRRLEYVARCPKCGASVKVKVGPEGVPQRLFRAGPA